MTYVYIVITGYVHENKIVHRDVKTANIFLTSQNMIKIGDFGIAKVLSSTADMAQTVVGTPYYLSPELCENRPYNSKSDVWALGCVLYELIMLEHAFKGGNMAALILNIIRGGYDPLPNDTNRCSPSLKSMVDKMLQRDFNNRPSTKEILTTEMVQGEMDKMGITPPTPVRRKRIDQKLGNNNNINNNNSLELMVESENSDEDDEDIAPPSYSPPPQQQQQQIVRNNHHNNALLVQQEERQLTPERSAAAVREMMRRKLREQRNAKSDDPELSRSTNIRKRLEGNKKAFQREAIRKGLQVLESRGNSRNNTPQQNTNNINASKNNISFSSPQLFLNLKSPSPVHNSHVQNEVEQQLEQENVPTYEARLSLGLGLASVDENNQKNTMEIDDDEDVPTFNVRFSSGYGGRHSPRFSTGGQL
jgi:serine/threonine protein kinase